ncbi:MAG: serine/threonine protein kinase [Phycisphaerae bacterium]|nr:serine/threonine protein kinase [Phycisphaerae bacterium]
MLERPMPEHADLRRIFDLVIDLPAAERPAALARECGGDDALRRRLEAMLAAADDDRFLVSPTSSPAAQTIRTSAADNATLSAPMREGPGSRIGPYKLLQLIGEGGFGSVFMAEQERPVQRRVALKIIKLGMDTRQVIARFEAERQALALMDHPNIARVLDAGSTDAGRPYFVMELCKGDPITDYCDRNNLAIRDRLELFVQVCQAVQHAHLKGVIHRDLKPSNILVATHDGRPHAKVIDFGIAKATASRLTEKTLFTEHRQLIGTPEYMSPEQAEGSLDIDMRTDVYSLGVLLYELLTGSTPFDSAALRSAAFGEIQRIIREVEPPKPSTRLSRAADTIASVAARRGIEPKRLGTIARGELDWIVMKALEKDRARRYDSAQGLASDIGRYLFNEAVLAAPPGRVYRLRKFVRRHRGPVVGSALVAAALVLGVIGTTAGLVDARRQKQAAEHARTGEAQQRALAETRLAEAEATVAFLDEMLGAANPQAQGRDVTVRAVLDKAALGMPDRFKDRPLVAARLHGTIGKTYSGLGDYPQATTHLREALALCERVLGADHRETWRARTALGTLLILSGSHDESERILKSAVEACERLFGADDDATAAARDALANLYALQIRTDDAIGLAREQVRARVKSLGKEHDDTVNALNVLGVSLMDTEQFDEAERTFTEVLAVLQRTRPATHPFTLTVRANLGLLHYQAAMAGKTTDPADYARRIELARTINEATLRDRTIALGEEHPDTLTSMGNLGIVYKELGRTQEADALNRKSVEISVKVLGENHPDTITGLANLGNSLRTQKKYAEAVHYLDRALKGARISHPPNHPGTAFILGWYSGCLRELGRYQDAEDYLLEARGIITRVMGEDHPIAGQMALQFQMLYEAWAKAEPDQGYDAKAALWKAKFDTAKKQ